MAFLLGKRTKSRSIKHPLGDRNDIQVLDADKIRELKARLVAGDSQAVDELTKAHIRMAIYIAGQYAMLLPDHAEDLVSEAMLGIAKACDQLAKRDVPDEQVTTFIAGRIHNLCSKLVRRTGEFRIPFTTAVRKKKEGKEVIVPQQHEIPYSQPGTKASKDKQVVFNHPKMCVNSEDKATELRDILNKAIKTLRQREVMDLMLEGYGIREIADKLQLTKSLVSLEIQTVRAEITRMLY